MGRPMEVVEGKVKHKEHGNKYHSVGHRRRLYSKAPQIALLE